MDVATRISVFKNPLAWIGLGFVFVSLAGLVLAIGNLVSLQYIPLNLVQQLREQDASILTSVGVPPEIVQRIQSGELISDAERSKLSKDQTRVLKIIEDQLPVMINALSQAAETSRNKSKIGIGVCIILLIVGAVLTAIAFRQTKRLRSEPA